MYGAISVVTCSGCLWMEAFFCQFFTFTTFDTNNTDNRVASQSNTSLHRKTAFTPSCVLLCTQNFYFGINWSTHKNGRHSHVIHYTIIFIFVACPIIFFFFRNMKTIHYLIKAKLVSFKTYTNFNFNSH